MACVTDGVLLLSAYAAFCERHPSLCHPSLMRRSAYAADETELRAAIDKHTEVIRLTSSIVLSRELIIEQNMSLLPSSAANKEIRVGTSDRRSRVLRVERGAHVTLCGLIVDGGHTWRQGVDGGAFRVGSGGSLTLAHCSVLGFLADNGGAVYVDAGGSLTVTHSLLTDNNAADPRSVPDELRGHGAAITTSHVTSPLTSHQMPHLATSHLPSLSRCRHLYIIYLERSHTYNILIASPLPAPLTCHITTSHLSRCRHLFGARRLCGPAQQQRGG